MKKAMLLVLGLSFGVGSAHAQLSAPPIPSVLPNVAKMSAGNAAGVLQYCMKNHLVSTVSAGTVVDNLTKKPEITKSSDFSTGQAGQIVADKRFSIAKAPSHLKSQACDMVLKQGKHLL